MSYEAWAIIPNPIDHWLLNSLNFKLLNKKAMSYEAWAIIPNPIDRWLSPLTQTRTPL